jgi:signal transduction histidine kinase
MLYIVIGLGLICIYFAIRFLALKQSIRNAAFQMDKIEEQKESNRKLKAVTSDKDLELLLNRINKLYEFRQEERISYQRREHRLQREVENISHDLRTPLTSIMGYTELIQDPGTSQEERQEYLSIIYKRAKVLQGFIEDFYELSRFQGENYPLRYEILQVQPIIKEVLVSYYRQFEKKQIQVEIHLEDERCSIIADRVQFNRILNNLIQNALKYTKTSFTLIQYSAQENCIIRFCNDNTDLTDEDMKRIFDRFYTGDENRSGQSTGLGLTIAKLLVENMKGSIHGELKDGRFTIELSFKIKEIS